MIWLLSIFRSNYKLFSFIGLIILVIILYLRGQSEKHRADEAEKGRTAAIALSNKFEGQSTTYRNKLGDQIIRTQTLEVDKSNIEALSKSKELQWLRKFDGLKGNASNLSSASTFSSDFDFDQVPEKIKWLPCKDSVKGFVFELHDKWNYIHVMALDTPKIEIHDKYYGVIELKRPKGWFWKFQWSKREAVSEITNSNKLIKIDSVAILVVTK